MKAKASQIAKIEDLNIYFTNRLTMSFLDIIWPISNLINS